MNEGRRSREGAWIEITTAAANINSNIASLP